MTGCTPREALKWMLVVSISFTAGLFFEESVALAIAQPKDYIEAEVEVDVAVEANMNKSTETFSCPRQVYNFIDELQCRKGHMSVPKILLAPGQGKVVVDVGLDAGLEFFAAINSSYSVFGFEANPLTVKKLRVKCDALGSAKCEYVDPETATFPLTPKKGGGYLIGAGLGETDGQFEMSLSGPGSSFVEDAPGKSKGKATVRVLRLDDVVKTDVFFFKLDVQGAEFGVLKGAKNLFAVHKVKTLLMEVYPRGLGHAGVNMFELLNYMYDDLGLFCSTASGSFGNHANSIKEFAAMLETKTGATWWGAFDDVFCFSNKKTWNTRRRLIGGMDNMGMEVENLMAALL